MALNAARLTRSRVSGVKGVVPKQLVEIPKSIGSSQKCYHSRHGSSIGQCFGNGLYMCRFRRADASPIANPD